MAEFSFVGYKSTHNSGGDSKRPDINYFKIDGDEGDAIVRINYSKPEDIKLNIVHKIKVGGKYKTVNCISDDAGACPLCESGSQAVEKIYVPMIQYINNENGGVSVYPVIWERSRTFGNTLITLMEEYPNLKDYVFKIKKITTQGKQYPTYELIPANQSVYKEEIYVKDFSAFDNFKVLGRFVADRTYEDLRTFVQTGDLPNHGKVVNSNVPNTIPEPKGKVEPSTSFAQHSVSAVQIPPVSQPKVSTQQSVVTTQIPQVMPTQVVEKEEVLVTSYTPTPAETVEITQSVTQPTRPVRQPKRFGL